MGFAFSLILAPLMYFSGSAVPCIIAHALFNAFYGLGWVYPIKEALQPVHSISSCFSSVFSHGVSGFI
jgi:membrane protease YdiL (CAAX protease family)